MVCSPSGRKVLERRHEQGLAAKKGAVKKQSRKRVCLTKKVRQPRKLEELDYSKLAATYSRKGRIEYSPRLLFKVILYACTRGIYRSREIERACRENVNFMYLLEGQRAPDHNIIVRFRSKHLPEAIEDLLYQLVQLLVEQGEISFEESAVFIDGTKVEANC